MITLEQINKPLDLNNSKAFNDFWYYELYNELQGDFDWWKIRSTYYNQFGDDMTHIALKKVAGFDSANTIIEVLKNLMINKTKEIRIILD